MSIQPTTATPPAAAREPAAEGLWGRDGFGFDDLVDIVNPLQHLPVVGNIYRAVSGDEIGHAPRLAGGFLFGGLIGGAMAAVNVAVDASTGRDLGEHAIAWLAGDEKAGPAPDTAARAYADAAAALAPAPHAAPWPDRSAPVRPRAADVTLRSNLSGASDRLLAELARRAESEATERRGIVA